MASRREFLQTGFVASIFPIVASADHFTPARVTTPVSLYKVIFDTRFAASRAFARRGEQLGAAVQGIEGDVTALWYHDLHARWSAGPVAMAGLTLNGALFCLDILARNHGMRVVYRREHKYRAGGSVEHNTEGLGGAEPDAFCIGICSGRLGRRGCRFGNSLR